MPFSLVCHKNVNMSFFETAGYPTVSLIAFLLQFFIVAHKLS